MEKKKLKELHFSHFQYKLKTLFFFNCAFIFCQTLLRNLFFLFFECLLEFKTYKMKKKKKKKKMKK